MKYLLFLTIFFLPNKIVAQTFVKKPNIYVYNNLKDTLYLSEINAGQVSLCDTLKIIDTIQVDGFGAKEIVFFRKCNSFNNKHGGSYDISESISLSKYEVWNLDTKQMIFEATNFYNSDFNRFNIYQYPRHIKGNKSYSYEFKIDVNGIITISNLKKNSKVFTVEWKKVTIKGKSETIVKETPYNYEFNPDKTGGVYRYVNGKYIYE